VKELLRRFFVRDDPEYDTLVQKYQAGTLAGKWFAGVLVTIGLDAYQDKGG
jgi:hypothetical protein